jgi:asparagine synthase (glutamine-hydrolysing)
MRNDVPTASCLSGGLDSSSVFCSIMKIKETVVPTEEVPENSHIGFVASYMNDIDNEVEYAKEVITHTKSTAYYFEIDQCNLLNEYFDIIYSYENISDIHIGPWLLFKKMRDLGIYVSIDGHGGDELLAGYPQYINSLLQAIAFNWHPVQLIKNICRYLMIIDGFNGNKYKDNKSLFYNDLISSLILVVKKILNHPVFFEKEKKIKQSINPNRNIQDILTYLPKSFFDDQERIANKGLLFRQLYLDYHYFLLPTNLRDFDLLSMAHGVEVRSPFLDWRLVCFVFSLQEKSLIDKSFTKRILRDSMKGILPDLVRMRRAKGGFANPHASWKFSVLDEFIMSNLTSHSFKEYSNDIWPNIIDDYKDAINTNNVERLFSIWQHLMSYWLIKIFKRKRDELIYVN